MLAFPIRKVLCIYCAVALCLTTFQIARADEKPSTANVGKKIDPFELKDTQGQTHTFDDFKDKKAAVYVFLSFDCPVSRSYAQPLSNLTKEYADKGVALFGICVCDEKPDELAKSVSDYKITFPVLMDPKGITVERFKAETTPEAFVIDDKGVLQYRGKIDNMYAARLKKNEKTTEHDLKRVLDEIVAGKEISRPNTQAIGCSIQVATIGKPSTGAVTYYRDVLPILQNNCQNCHRPGEVGPFSLMTYKQAVNWSSDIKEFTETRKMPPWKPTDSVPLHNERKLSDKDIATLAAWADGGTPEGNSKEAPPPRKFTDGWQLGKPDLILTPAAEFQVGPTGKDVFRCFVLPSNLAEDKYVAAVEVRPGNTRVVHHALLFLDRTGQGRQLQEKEQERKPDDSILDRGLGYSVGMGGIGFLPQGSLSGWAPGQMARWLPDGTGFFLPKNSDVIMQLHYHRDGKLEKDKTSVGLYFAKKPVTEPWKGMIIPGLFEKIPAGNEHFEVKGGITMQQDCILRSVMPHMHMLGKEIAITIEPPGGPKTTLLAIKDWDYNWQETYFLKDPIALKNGTHLSVQAVYDNTGNNPLNPFDPPRDVAWGEQTTNEMCFIFLGATSDSKPGRIKFDVDNKLALLKNRLRRNQEREKDDDIQK
jgi:peroxiredoxin